MIKELTMDESSNDRGSMRFNRLIIAVTLMGLLCINGPAIHSKLSVHNHKSTAPLSLKLSIQDRTQCRGTSIKVDAELTNTSNESVAINPKYIWYEISFSAFKEKEGRSTGKSRTMVGDSGPHDESKYLVLRSGQSFKDSLTLPLTDKFFQDTGVYTMSVKYGQFHETSVDEVPMFTGTVTSNGIEFEIIGCKGKVRRKKD